MSNAVFPTVRGLGWSSVKTPEFSTIVQTGPALHTTRVCQSQNPIWHWQLLYDYLSDDPARIVGPATYTDLRTMMAFFMARQGQFDDFLFNDPDDNYAGPNQPLTLVSDGGSPPEYFSPLQRTMAGLFSEDVTDLNTSVTPLKVYANGVLTTDYDILGPGLAVPGASYSGLYLAWHHSPATPVTAEFGFYFRVVFESDKLDFEQFMKYWWTFGGENSSKSDVLKLKSSRVGSV